MKLWLGLTGMSVILLASVPAGATAAPVAATGPSESLSSILSGAGSGLTRDDVRASDVAPEILEDLRTAFPGVSDAAIYAGLATRRARALLTEAMSTDDTFAGQWFDWGTGTWHVASTAEQLPKRAAERAALIGLSVESQPADFTYADLYATYQAVLDTPGQDTDIYQHRRPP